MKTTKFTKIAVAVLATLSLSANAGGLLGDAPETGSKGNIDFGYVTTSGNSDTTSLNGAFGYVSRITDAYATGVTVTGINNSTNNIRSAEKYSFAWNNRYDLDDKSFLYGTLDYVNDYFGAYDYQTGLYLGYGYQVFKNDTSHFSLGVAAGYRINAAFIGDDEKEGVFRADLDYGYKFSETAAFTQKLTAIFGDAVDTYNSESAVTAKLSDTLALKVAYLVTHNSVVPVGLEKTDSTTSIGVSYSF